MNKTRLTDPNEVFNERVLESKSNEVKRNNIHFDEMVIGHRRGSWGKEHLCELVCGHCMEVASRRVASLCSLECLWEGHHFKACMTYYSLTD